MPGAGSVESDSTPIGNTPLAGGGDYFTTAATDGSADSPPPGRSRLRVGGAGGEGAGGSGAGAAGPLAQHRSGGQEWDLEHLATRLNKGGRKVCCCCCAAVTVVQVSMWGLLMCRLLIFA